MCLFSSSRLKYLSFFCIPVSIRIRYRLSCESKRFAHAHENIWATRNNQYSYFFQTMKIRACSTSMRLKFSFVSFVQYISLFKLLTVTHESNASNAAVVHLFTHLNILKSPAFHLVM